MRALHLSNSNILWDYRIQREMLSLQSLPEISELIGIGVNFGEGAKIQDPGIHVKCLNIFFSGLPRVPGFRIIRAGIVFAEFIIRMTINIIILKPRIIHCHDAPALLPALICSYFIKFELVYDAHELMMHKAGNNFFSSSLFFLIEKLAWPKIDLFITVGDEILRWYCAKYGEKKSEVILNSPTPRTLSQPHYEKDYLLKKFQIARSDSIFVFIGQFNHGRSIGEILKCFSKAQASYHVLFLGYGELEDEIVDHAETSSNIHFHPAIAHDHVVEFLSLCDFGLCLIENVSLSDELSMPNKLFEYLQAGLPIVASNLPELARVVRDLSCGVLISDVSADLETAIVRLAESNIEADNGRIAKYLWPAQSAKLLRGYASLAC